MRVSYAIPCAVDILSFVVRPLSAVKSGRRAQLKTQPRKDRMLSGQKSRILSVAVRQAQLVVLAWMSY